MTPAPSKTPPLPAGQRRKWLLGMACIGATLAAGVSASWLLGRAINNSEPLQRLPSGQIAFYGGALVDRKSVV